MGTFVYRIQDVKGVRRRLLESSKDLLHVLKGYYNILEIRDQKRETAQQLKSVMAELTRLLERVSSLVPAQPLKEIEAYLPKTSTAKKKNGKKGGGKTKKGVKGKASPHGKPRLSAKEKAAAKKASDVEKLEKALGTIEARLQQL